MTVPERLKVRIGAGWNPFGAGDGIVDGGFWSYVETLEELGIDSLWLPDTAQLGGVAPLPALAAVAARTERLKLGTGVLVLPPRNPVLLARELATVDALSGGRLLPAGGLGVGLPQELAAMAVPRGERVGRLEESVAIIRALWAGQPVTRAGRFWSLTDAVLTPRPHRARLEFWLGGTAPAALDRVGRIADGWLGSFVGPDEFPRMVARIRAAAAAADRSIDDDHFGTTVFSLPHADALPDEARALLDRPGGPRRDDHMAIGVDATRRLLERFIAGGATKFVLQPIAPDPAAWLRTLHPEVIVPLEAAGTVAPWASD